MPPRRGNTVKSGNAGNGRSSKSAASISVPDVQKSPPLFPPGYKYPLTLLNERCQKEGWDTPKVTTPRKGEGFAFYVDLTRLNKKTSERETVRLSPPPDTQLCLPTAIEARHWGAVYALYRFCNNIQLQLVLPPGPVRDYWNQLASQHKIVPDHQKWMYNPDPFAARKEVQARQTKTAQARQDPQTASSESSASRSGPVSLEFVQFPEVKMSAALRDRVEEVVKKVKNISLAEGDRRAVTQKLKMLGFTQNWIDKALSFLAVPSALLARLRDTLMVLDTAIEFLMLHVPESELPGRFLPSNNSSTPFVSSIHSGSEDLAKRWMEEEAIKKLGWPHAIVKECSSHPDFLPDWSSFVATLGQKLIGSEAVNSQGTVYEFNTEDVAGLGGQLDGDGHLVLPLFSSPVELHLLLSEGKYPRRGYLPAYLTSSTMPSYIRLHLLSCLLAADQDGTLLDHGEGLCMAAMQLLENEIERIESNGPPEISSVLRHVLPSAQPAPIQETIVGVKSKEVYSSGKSIHKFRDRRSDGDIQQAWKVIQDQPEYATLLSSREELPAFSVKSHFLHLLQNSRVVVVTGETGSGKSTQLPQFILNDLVESGRGSCANIIVTQPRRISALGVASRVGEERLNDGSVGYAIWGETTRSSKTKLLFCTTGVVLRRLSSGNRLEGVTHIIVDEVHERSVDGDFLLLQLKELLPHHPNLRVILMSATINHELFLNYFSKFKPPLLNIMGRIHPVRDLYMEDIAPMLRPYRLKVAQGKKKDMDPLKERHPQLQDDDIALLHLSELSNGYRIIAAIVNHIVSTSQVGGILIFLPGKLEIKQCIEAIQAAISSNIKAKILPLHGTLTIEEQRKVFQPFKGWKIVASTNVAETSITIDDIMYVIDSGKVKEVAYDAAADLTTLKETWISRAASKQRRGRAGRTGPGVCYKVFTKHREAFQMQPSPTPEILRVPLENISLSIKVLRPDENVKHFLANAIESPDVSSMDKAWNVLKEIGAIDEQDGLTGLGRYIAMLPMDLRLGKMLLFGCIFRCLDPILSIAAILSSKSLFNSPFEERDQAKAARAKFFTGNSDLLTDLNAYDACTKMQAGGSSLSVIRTFCEENFISSTTLRDINFFRSEFFSNLIDNGLIPHGSLSSSDSLNVNSAHLNLIKAILVSGVWPRVASIRLPKDAIKFERVQAGTIQKENHAKEYKVFSLQNGRVFLHPGSILFDMASWKTPMLAYFNQQHTSKIFLRDATEVPFYAILLFGGQVTVNHVQGGLTVGEGQATVKFKAWPRIGVLVNQLRRLLDAQLRKSIDDGTPLNQAVDIRIIDSILSLLAGDGLSDAGRF